MRKLLILLVLLLTLAMPVASFAQNQCLPRAERTELQQDTFTQIASRARRRCRNAIQPRRCARRRINRRCSLTRDNSRDPDLDGVRTSEDNAPTVPNPDQLDTDGDGIGDAADNAPTVPNPDQVDTDGDGIGDATDNCPMNPNPDQMDADMNGLGDACEIVDIVSVEAQNFSGRVHIFLDVRNSENNVSLPSATLDRSSTSGVALTKNGRLFVLNDSFDRIGGLERCYCYK